jgi:hypothetical protein
MKDEDWGTDTVIVWHIALNDLGMTQQEFSAAKRKSLSLSWPPTAPADFLALGRIAGQSEYPDNQEAFDIACRNCGMRGQVERDWVHGTIYETATRIGWGKLANADYGFMKYFSKVYQQVVSEHKNGATFVVPESHQVEYSHNPVTADSPKAAEIDNFLSQFVKKGSMA